MSPQGETAVEQAIYSLGGTLFGKIINPLIIVFVAFAIALFLYIVFKSIIDRSRGTVQNSYKNLLWPIIGLSIMLGAVGITFFIGNTGNEVFQGQPGAGAVKGINDVTKPIPIR
jgi:hypothetical protein